MGGRRKAKELDFMFAFCVRAMRSQVIRRTEFGKYPEHEGSGWAKETPLIFIGKVFMAFLLLIVAKFEMISVVVGKRETTYLCFLPIVREIV